MGRSFLKILFIFILGLMVMAPSAFALTVLKNQEAANILGNIKSHILSSPYTFDILSRNHRDSMHGRFSDGVLFSPGSGRLLYLRRKDGDYKIVINSPQGREKEPANEEHWRQKIDNALSDDNTSPYVFWMMRRKNWPFSLSAEALKCKVK